MNMTVQLDQRSLNTTLKALKQFGDNAKKVIKSVVDRTALAVETDAKNKLKTDKHIVTGRLRASIHAELSVNEKNSYKDDLGNVFDGSLNEPIAELEAVAGTNVEYGPKIEYNYDSFIRWAGENQKEKFVKRMKDALNKLISEQQS